MPTKLKHGYTDPVTQEWVPPTEVVREVDGMIVRLTVHGLFLKEKGRRLEIGPLDYETLYRDAVQRSNGLSPIKPRKGRASAPVSRGLLATERGR
ncbi:MAG: hypothetical protein H3C62_02880 [Gemmatimonadaceae bacterium]|nr:hypothetical protein [Gemmatimonadaceae bacterium]